MKKKILYGFLIILLILIGITAFIKIKGFIDLKNNTRLISETVAIDALVQEENFDSFYQLTESSNSLKLNNFIFIFDNKEDKEYFVKNVNYNLCNVSDGKELGICMDTESFNLYNVYVNGSSEENAKIDNYLNNLLNNLDQIKLQPYNQVLNNMNGDLAIIKVLTDKLSDKKFNINSEFYRINKKHDNLEEFKNSKTIHFVIYHVVIN